MSLHLVEGAQMLGKSAEGYGDHQRKFIDQAESSLGKSRIVGDKRRRQYPGDVTQLRRLAAARARITNWRP
ncbi:MAG: hypothetical protein R3C43_03840 [Chloroflexota bacterium]